MAQESKPEQKQMLKYTVLHWKDEGVDDQTFSKWYKEEFIPRMLVVLKRHNVDHFKLYLTPSALREKFQQDLEKFKGEPGWKMTSHDVTSSYYVDDPDKLRGLLTDPDWAGKVNAFEKGWIDLTRGDVQIGWETVFLENNQIVNTVPKEGF